MSLSRTLGAHRRRYGAGGRYWQRHADLAVLRAWAGSYRGRLRAAERSARWLRAVSWRPRPGDARRLVRVPARRGRLPSAGLPQAWPSASGHLFGAGGRAGEDVAAGPAAGSAHWGTSPGGFPGKPVMLLYAI